jgi:hypothetical protein
MSTNLYDTDFYAWTQRQSELIRTGKVSEIDFEHLAEEIEDMGRSQKRALESRLEVLLLHLLKWKYQPDYRGKSWVLTIREQRLRIADLLEENPSLSGQFERSIEKAYPLAVLWAERETGLEVFPERCPFAVMQILDRQFLPE